MTNITRDNVFDALVQAVQEVLAAETTVSGDDSFIETYGMDSLDAREVLIEVEDVLHIIIDEKRLIPVRTVNEFVDVVYAQIHEKQTK